MKQFVSIILVALIGAAGFLVPSLFRYHPQDTVGVIYEVIRYVGNGSDSEVKYFSNRFSKEDREMIRRYLVRSYMKDKYQTPP